jgi:hypothetical protein
VQHPIDKELARIRRGWRFRRPGERQRRHPIDLLARYPERNLARRHDRQSGCGAQQFGDKRSSAEHAFEVVQQQARPQAKVVGEHRFGGLGARLAHACGAGNR